MEPLICGYGVQLLDGSKERKRTYLQEQANRRLLGQHYL